MAISIRERANGQMLLQGCTFDRVPALGEHLALPLTMRAGQQPVLVLFSVVDVLHQRSGLNVLSFDTLLDVMRVQ